MNTNKAIVRRVAEIKKHIFFMELYSPEIASSIKPGQFCNIKVSESVTPLLRRPFSICDVENDNIFFMFDVSGEGTKLLSQKQEGDILDILAPLGNGFNYSGDYDNAVLVAGGLGSAPFPYFLKNLDSNKSVISFIGGRTSNEVITYGIKNYYTSTDDGSEGFHGNVIQLLEYHLDKIISQKSKIFSCGPTPMLRALKEFCLIHNLDCEVSTEAAMACGFGICQGCPIESSDKEKYLLVCKDGPVFNIKDVIL